jgi:hypothetical protein
MAMKCANAKRGGQVAAGLTVIAVGVLFLLHNLDIISFGHALSFWPAVLIVAGVLKLADARSPNGRMVGAMLLGAGVLLTLNRLGLLHFSWRVVWPLIVIGMGGMVVFRAMAARHGHGGSLKDGVTTNDDFVDGTAILGAFERRLSTPHFAGGDLTAIMGGCTIDLRGCSLQGEAVVNVFALMGGISLKCPADWTVVLSGTPIMGGFEEKTVRPPDGSKRLVVKGYAFMGGVDVRN